MGLFGSLLAHLRALRLTRKAFLYVEIGRYQEAIELLDQAIRLDPAIGDAYNELAFIHGKLMGNLDVAEKYAWQAIECEPDNPKFYNSINSILVGRAKRLKTRSAIIQSIRNRLEEIELNINADPDYPPAHLTRAVAIALIGAPQAQWESALETARSLYVQQGTSATGFKLTPVEISDIIRRNYAECLEASSCWDNTPDDFVSGNELSRHTPFALNTCHDKCYAGDATHDNHAAGRHLTRRANTSILERSRDAITSTHNSCHKSTNDLSFGKQMLPSILAQPRHYQDECRAVGGTRCHVTLEQASFDTYAVNLLYRWNNRLSYMQADKLDSRLRAFIACAVYDAAIGAELNCIPGPPHGRRPSWIIEGFPVPYGLQRAGFDVGAKSCWLRIGPVITGISESARLNEAFAASFKRCFSAFSV